MVVHEHEGGLKGQGFDGHTLLHAENGGLGSNRVRIPHIAMRCISAHDCWAFLFTQSGRLLMGQDNGKT
ncbi:MAG: hypothetical protein M1415_03095 [Firmicutes bacterium]|nr:hypothetical protein [Bacillota bacterium]